MSQVDNAPQLFHPDPGAEPPPNLVSIQELARRLGVSAGTIRSQVRKGGIPYTQFGRFRKYNVKAVVAVLEDRASKVPPTRAELAQAAETLDRGTSGTRRTRQG